MRTLVLLLSNRFAVVVAVDVAADVAVVVAVVVDVAVASLLVAICLQGMIVSGYLFASLLMLFC